MIPVPETMTPEAALAEIYTRATNAFLQGVRPRTGALGVDNDAIRRAPADVDLDTWTSALKENPIRKRDTDGQHLGCCAVGAALLGLDCPWFMRPSTYADHRWPDAITGAFIAGFDDDYPDPDRENTETAYGAGSALRRRFGPPRPRDRANSSSPND